MSAALTALCEQLHLRHLATALPAWLDRAAHDEPSYADFVRDLLEVELAARAVAETQRRLRQAGFPCAASIEQFDFTFRPELQRQVILRYLDPALIEQAGTLTLIGPPGLGKPFPTGCPAGADRSPR